MKAPFRDDAEGQRARADRAERELSALREKARASAAGKPGRWRWRAFIANLGVVLFMIAADIERVTPGTATPNDPFTIWHPWIALTVAALVVSLVLAIEAD